MKRLVATALLFGYVLLVPFCFFGGALSVHAIGMNMGGGTLHQMNDCAMQLGGCAQGAVAGAMDPVAHHLPPHSSSRHLLLLLVSLSFGSRNSFAQHARLTRCSASLYSGREKDRAQLISTSLSGFHFLKPVRIGHSATHVIRWSSVFLCVAERSLGLVHQ